MGIETITVQTFKTSDGTIFQRLEEAQRQETKNQLVDLMKIEPPTEFKLTVFAAWVIKNREKVVEILRLMPTKGA